MYSNKGNQMTIKDLVSSIVNNIEKDVDDRHTLGDALRLVDKDTREHIRQSWEDIVLSELVKAKFSLETA
jgi:hypothetical protein